MNNKRSLAILSLPIIAALCAPQVAYAAVFLPEEIASGLPENLPAIEQMVFSPPLYLTLVLVVLLVCAAVVCAVLAVQLRQQKRLVCHNNQCINNPEAHENGLWGIDFSEVETPEELCTGYNDQSSMAVAEAIKRLIMEQEESAPPAKQAARLAKDSSHLSIVPEMRHAVRRRSFVKPESEQAPVPVPEELEQLLRKIS